MRITSMSSSAFSCTGLLGGGLSFGCEGESVLSLPRGIDTSSVTRDRGNSCFRGVLSGPLFVTRRGSTPITENATRRGFLRCYGFRRTETDLSARVSHLLGSKGLARRRISVVSEGALGRFLSAGLVSHVVTSRLMVHRGQFATELGPSRMFSRCGSMGASTAMVVRNTISLTFIRSKGLIVISCGASEVGSVVGLTKLCGGRLCLCGSTVRRSRRLAIGRYVLYDVRLNTCVAMWGRGHPWVLQAIWSCSICVNYFYVGRSLVAIVFFIVAARRGGG